MTTKANDNMRRVRGASAVNRSCETVRVRDGRANRERGWQRGARFALTGASLALLGACSAQAPASDPVATGDLSENLYVTTGSVSSTRSVRVCWATSGLNGRSVPTVGQKSFVRSQIQKTWGAESGIVFYGWSDCIPGETALPVFSDSGAFFDGAVVHLDFAASTGGLQQDTTHEFGHAMGF
jgi:hypothetical protein